MRAPTSAQRGAGYLQNLLVPGLAARLVCGTCIHDLAQPGGNWLIGGEATAADRLENANKRGAPGVA